MFELDIEEIPYGKNTQKASVSQSVDRAPVAPKKERMKRLQFLKTGTKKYRFNLKGEALMYAMHSNTEVEFSWLLNVQEIRDDSYILNIITYDNQLKQSNEQGLKELYYVTSMFQKIYEDIKVQVSLEGKVEKVLNSDTLVRNWQRFKKESIQYFGTETNLEEYFAVSDEQFSSPDFIQTLVNKLEFFFVYFQASGYNRKFSSVFNVYEIVRNNAFEKGEIKWLTRFTGKEEIIEDSPLGEMEIDGDFQPNKKWLQDAYGYLPFLKTDELKPEFKLNGRYVFYNSSGWLKEAILEVNEIVDTKQLFHKLKYSIKEID